MSAISILAQVDKKALDNGMELRLVSAWELLDIRREALELSSVPEDRALCLNACLIGKALESEGVAVFDSGKAVLQGLSVEEIGALAKEWGAFNQKVNPAPSLGEEALEELKKN